MSKDSIVLIGFMGSGKSSVGKILAEKTGFEWIDTDSFIEQEEERSISDIFRIEGETYFRKVETTLLTRLVKDDFTPRIFSIGGGTPITPANQPLLHQLGFIVYLSASPITIQSRLQTDTSRPLLQNDSWHETLQALMTKRLPVYEEMAQITVSTDQKEVEEIASIILDARKQLPY
ncbi:MAG: shikimate kinase [Lachnospiraceae bacterium]|jgi:shikimate kinase|nr:shikimate kinase [Lachnospiraceae bacterium]